MRCAPFTASTLESYLLMRHIRAPVDKLLECVLLTHKFFGKALWSCGPKIGRVSPTLR
jgi:hypothetical protein